MDDLRANVPRQRHHAQRRTSIATSGSRAARLPSATIFVATAILVIGPLISIAVYATIYHGLLSVGVMLSNPPRTHFIDLPGSFYQHVMKAECKGFHTSTRCSSSRARERCGGRHRGGGIWAFQIAIRHVRLAPSRTGRSWLVGSPSATSRRRLAGCRSGLALPLASERPVRLRRVAEDIRRGCAPHRHHGHGRAVFGTGPCLMCPMLAHSLSCRVKAAFIDPCAKGAGEHATM